MSNLKNIRLVADEGERVERITRQHTEEMVALVREEIKLLKELVEELQASVDRLSTER